MDTYSGKLFQFSTILMLAHTERLDQSIFNKNTLPIYPTPCPGVHYANVLLRVITRAPFLSDPIRKVVGGGKGPIDGGIHELTIPVSFGVHPRIRFKLVSFED
ncbi:hypothetical protein CDAR_492871 [Caerostris darwini]|uniref:Uncharacterized protein n=1 Tax=Caerostris darwini TaxID=1538125 RepID=A0AAV4TE02_9ARAC|nr:hypothetical protein CDAR_492871 [Caerostris darwini]